VPALVIVIFAPLRRVSLLAKAYAVDSYGTSSILLFARRNAGYPAERAGEVIRAEVSNLGHRSQGKRFVYPLPHLRDDPLYDRAVRRVDVGKTVGFEPYRGLHERILRGRIRFPSPRFRLRPCSLASLAAHGAFKCFMIPTRTSRRAGRDDGPVTEASGRRRLLFNSSSC
jgi:hypothetical protein